MYLQYDTHDFIPVLSHNGLSHTPENVTFLMFKDDVGSTHTERRLSTKPIIDYLFLYYP